MIKKFTEKLSDRGLLGYVKILLRGAAQVMFQSSAWTGLLFFVGIFWGAWQVDNMAIAWGALLGVMVSTTTGYLLNLNQEEGSQGLWGFNGVLVGCAFPTFLGGTLWMWVALCICAAFTVWLREALNNMMRGWRINSVTFPFVLSTWFFLLASRGFRALEGVALATPTLPENMPTGGVLYLSESFDYILGGLSEVFLIDSWVTGMCFLIGLLLASRWAALWAVVGSVVGILFASVMSASAGDIAQGIYGYNAVLTAIALATVFYRPSWRSALWAIMGVIISVVVQAALGVMFAPLGMPTLTAPFCLTTWLFLLPMLRLDTQTPDHSAWHSKC